MAKQSAKSKGYRKTVKKKPFLTKKEIIELVVIVAVIVVGIVLFNLFYDDGYLRASDVQPGDVVSYVSRDIGSRYVKVATANELPGFSYEQPDMSENAAPSFLTYVISKSPKENAVSPTVIFDATRYFVIWSAAAVSILITSQIIFIHLYIRARKVFRRA